MRSIGKKYNVDRLSNEYLLIYIIFLIIITFSKFTVYSIYLHSLYKFTIIISILINLFFLLFFTDFNGHKNILDYFIIIFTLIVIFMRIIFRIQILTFPLITILLFISNLRYINLKKFIKSDFYTRIIIFVTVVALYLLHFMPYQSITHRNGLLRLDAGFAGYNEFAEIVLCLTFSYVLLMNKKIYRVKNISVLCLIILITFMLTDSRGFILSSIIMLLLIIIGKLRVVRHVVITLSIPAVVLCIFLAIYMPIHTFTDESVFNKLNGLLSNRLALQHLTAQNYPIKLTGYTSMNILNFLKIFNFNRTIYIDNTYLMLLLTCGIIGLCIFLFVLIKSCFISLQLSDYILCITIISLSAYIMIETSFFNINCYVPIMYAFILNHNKRNDVLL